MRENGKQSGVPRWWGARLGGVVKGLLWATRALLAHIVSLLETQRGISSGEKMHPFLGQKPATQQREPHLPLNACALPACVQTTELCTAAPGSGGRESKTSEGDSALSYKDCRMQGRERGTTSLCFERLLSNNRGERDRQIGRNQ